MCALLGIMFFFFGLGMATGLLLSKTIFVILTSGICLLCGYYLFCR